ncbi:Rdx family protein [Tissierella sp. Yu-01]|nr:Rdx family protein [Tissierella sp. Yu-01]WFA10464.1 Rdx family protein [Tissierella sp. Yu-01]
MSRAVALAKNLLDEHKNDIEELTIVPSSGGVFEIQVNDNILFSKKELGRFPEDGEAERLIREELSK